MPRGRKKTESKLVVSNKFPDKRVGIPTAEESSYADRMALTPVELKYPRNPDLDPQLVWRGKDRQDEHPLEVRAYPIYIQEKIHPQTIVRDLMNETKERAANDEAPDLFGDFNGVPEGTDRTDFYHYEKNWTNRMILGDSLQVMASLAEKEGLRGQVQCIYMDPPYGIKFNSNFQWSTTSPNQKDGVDITREPEMVRAFRDTWREGIHSYLSYLRDRLIIARDLLADTGSVFVQIGDENVHRVRALLDEVFGPDNFVSMLFTQTTTGAGSPAKLLAPPSVGNYVLWYSKAGKEKMKYREVFRTKVYGAEGSSAYKKLEYPDGRRISVSNWQKEEKRAYVPEKEISMRLYGLDNFTSQAGGDNARPPIFLYGKKHTIEKGSWKTSAEGIERLKKAHRLDVSGNGKIGYVRYYFDFPAMPIPNVWTDTVGQNQFGGDKIYVVQTGLSIVQRCLLMTTDPGDLVLDPTCGSGTTAYVAEQWGRRWITIDTSRVALALARARLMGARFPYYLLADSREGQIKEGEIMHRLPSEQPTYGNIRFGFVYERIPHVTLKSIANNSEIDVIWENYAPKMDELRKKLGGLEEWEVPRPDEKEAKKLPQKELEAWWELRLKRQKEIDESIAAHAEFEYLYDKPYVDNSVVRVTGPFTVESLDPHRMLGVDEDGNLIDPLVLMQTNDVKAARNALYDCKPAADFTAMILDNLRIAGVQQMDKKDRIEFETLEALPGSQLCAEGKYMRGDKQIRAAIFLGPEFGTVSRTDLVEAAREASENGFDEMIALAFNYDAQSSELNKLGRLPILKGRINADLHMAEDLKTTNNANLFVVFGEPDIDILKEGGKLRVKIKGVDIFKPQEGRVVSGDTSDIACWFIDTNYNEESFFVRHAYFLGQKDPYDSLRKTLNTEIDKDAWESIHSDLSRPFDIPETGRIAVKIINHLGDEVLKVYGRKDWE